MAKQMIEVDVPEGYEAVRVGEPAPGEWFVCRYMPGRVLQAKAGDGNYYRLIVRPAWKWPEWLVAPYIAMDTSGEWYAYNNKPTPGAACWGSGACIFLWSKCLAFTPPPCSDWTQSLRRNPRCTEAQ